MWTDSSFSFYPEMYAFSSQQQKFGGNLRHVRLLSFKILYQMKFSAYYQLHILSLRKNSFTWSISSCPLLIDGCPQAFHIFACLHPTFELGKSPKNFCSSPVCCSNATFNILNVPVTFFPHLKQNFIHILLIQVCIFLFMTKLQTNQLKQLNKTLLNSHMCCSLIQSRKWLGGLFSLSFRNLC